LAGESVVINAAGENLISAQIQIRLGIIMLWNPLRLSVGESQLRENHEQRENQGMMVADIISIGWISAHRVSSKPFDTRGYATEFKIDITH